MELPILVGISRKRMIHQLLGITAAESLNGTTVLNTISLMKGANILRVHDVRPAVEAVSSILHINYNPTDNPYFTHYQLSSALHGQRRW